MSDVRHDQVRQIVRQQYAAWPRAATRAAAARPSCCGTSSPEAVSQALGYSADELAAVPDGRRTSASAAATRRRSPR